ncbi:hypothetical protein CAPTEDRAFT_116561, partial [Capitella teleta]
MTTLQSLKKQESAIDITLKLPDETTIPCHKLVLMVASPFFATMFQSGMKESKQPEVQLEFSDAATIRMLIDYFYSGDIDINSDNMMDLVAASEFLCLADLKQHLGSFMTNEIDSANCIDFYMISQKYSLTNLIPHCLEYILSHFTEAFKESDDFLNLTEKELTTVLADDRLIAENEDFVFHSVVRWVNADLEKRKGKFVQIAALVRFPFSTQGLLDHLSLEPLMLNPTC